MPETPDPSTSADGEAIREPKGTAETPEQLIEVLEDDIFRYGKALQEVRTVYRDTQNGWVPDTQKLTRETVRGMQSDLGRGRRLLQWHLTEAKACAQQTVWFDNEDARETYSRHRSQAGRTLSPTSSAEAITVVVLSEIFVRAFEAEAKLCLPEKRLEQHVRQFIEEDPVRVATLFDYLCSADFDQEEYRPFLAFLAKNTFDPIATQVIKAGLSSLQEQPDHHMPFFCSLLDAASDSPEDSTTLDQFVGPQNAAWLRFFQQATAPDGGKTTLGELFQHQPLEAWPTPLYDSLLEHLKQFRGDLLGAYKSFLEPYKVPINFYIDTFKLCEEAIQIVDSSGSKRHTKRAASKATAKHPGGRAAMTKTTANRMAAAIAAQERDPEPLPAITQLDYVMGADGPHHYRARGLITPSEEPEALSELDIIKDYLRKHSSDPDLVDDIETMVLSILDEPFGNGASKIKGKTENVLVDEKFTKLPVRHLNPAPRTLSIGDTARYTRIYYVVYRSNDRRVIGITDISHKNRASKLRNDSGQL